MSSCVYKSFLRLTALVLSLMILSGCTPDEASDITDTTEDPYSNPIAAEQLAQELKIGWCLGNTFDAPDGETSWGNPFTTKELLLKVKELGFNTIRIPVSWGRHVGPAPEYMINDAFLGRVTTVVQDALDAGLYVIINSHHDNDIYTPTAENRERALGYLQAIWTQLSNHFREIDHRLIFQPMNEPRVVGTSYEWGIDLRNDACVTSMKIVNELNQVALDAIRAGGGYNAERFVIVTPYVANPQAAVTSVFALPQDSADNKLIVSVHAYTPYNLCLNVNSKESSFGMKQLTEIRSFMKNLNRVFVSKGIPVIIDEMGCIYKENHDARYAWAKAYVSAAKEYSMVCIWWDNGILYGSGEKFGLIDRTGLQVYPDSMSAYQGLMDGLAGTDTD